MKKKIKKTSQYIFLFLLSTVPFYSCLDYSTSPDLESGFMPLKVGNKYYYSSFTHGTEPNPENITEIWEVTGTKQFDGKDFFVVKRNFSIPSVSNVDTMYLYLRGDILFQLHIPSGNKPYVTSAIANFNLDINERFSSRDNMNYSVTVTEKTADKITFFFDSPGAVDEEYSVTYKNGAGLYETFSAAWRVGKRLVRTESR